MRIISKIKDYYDYVSFIYGEDKKFVYVRNMVQLWNLPMYNKTCPIAYYPVINEIRHARYEANVLYFVAVCGKLFPIKLNSFGLTYTAELVTEISTKFNQRKHKLNIGEFSQKMFDIQVEMKSPITIVEYNLYQTNSYNQHNMIVYPSSIVLGAVKNFVAIYSPEQIWQDIYYFIANQMHTPNADIDPPVSLPDKYKIIEHGFDPVISFRKRK